MNDLGGCLGEKGEFNDSRFSSLSCKTRGRKRKRGVAEQVFLN